MLRTQRAFAVAALSAVAFSACSHGGGQPQGAPPVAVDVGAAQRQDIATYVTLDGQITPLQNSVLSSQQSGTVTAVYVNEGQRVTAGTLLAKLDDSTLRAQLAQNEAAVTQAEAQLGGQTLQRNITPSQAQSTVATAQQQLQAAKNTVETNVAALSNAKLVYDSDDKLYTQGYVAQTTLEQARASYVAAQQAVISAQQQERQAQVALLQAQAQGSNAVPIQDQTVAAARATLAQSQAQVKLLQTEIRQTSLVAPFDGVITERLLDPGAYASPNQPIVQISQIDSVYVNANVPDTDLTWVKKGTPVTFVSTSSPGRTFAGTIFDVNATPTSGTLSYRARVVMPNPDNALRGGMLVTVSVRKEYAHDAIVVPLTSVVTNQMGTGVYTIVKLPPPPAGSGGGPPAGGPPGGAAGGGPTLAQAKFVPVKLGIQTDVLAQVISPQVGAGTTIITSRPDALQDKSLVAYSPAPAGGAAKGANAPEADAP
jgi:HlyD family secretion protein